MEESPRPGGTQGGVPYYPDDHGVTAVGHLNDGDDEDTNVPATGLDFARLDVHRLLEAVTVLGDGPEITVLADGQAVSNNRPSRSTSGPSSPANWPRSAR